MKFEAVLLRVVGMFTLLGFILFVGQDSAPPPAHEPAATRPSPTVEPEPEPAVPDELIDRVARPLDGLEPRRVIRTAAEPVVAIEAPNGTSPFPPQPLPELDPLPPTLTAGRRAALRVIFEGDAYLLFFGRPPGNTPEPSNPGITSIESGLPGTTTSPGLRSVSIGDSLDPELEEYVRHFNLQMLHAQRSGLIRTRKTDGVWSAAAHLDRGADELLFNLLDDPTDAIATGHDPETGVCELDLGQRDGIALGMRFVLWTQARPLRRVLALAEVSSVTDTRCQVRIVKALSDSWPAARGIRASSPFFHRGRKVAGYAIGRNSAGMRTAFKGWAHATLYEDLQFPEFCIVGDIPDLAPAVDPRIRRERAPFDAQFVPLLARAKQAGAILVPERLVPYLLPAR
jgi:hypothetical protein